MTESVLFLEVAENRTSFSWKHYTSRRKAALLQHVSQLLQILFAKSQAILAHGNQCSNVHRSMGSPAVLGMFILSPQ